jgi:hypothetical protein
LEMRSFRHLRSSSPPLVVHQFLRFATEREVSRSIAGYLGTYWLCSFLFRLEWLLFWGMGTSNEEWGLWGMGGFGFGVWVRLFMKMDGLSHYGCTCEVDGAEVERIALILRRIEGLSS